MSAVKGAIMKSNMGKQRGFSFLGFFFIVAVLITAVIISFKLIPAYMHNAEIGAIFKSIATDPAMTNATPHEIRQSYSKRAQIEGVTDISSEDIEIEQGEGPLKLNVNYSVKIPLISNITLLLEFNASST